MRSTFCVDCQLLLSNRNKKDDLFYCEICEHYGKTENECGCIRTWKGTGLVI
jgi:hypothetical protein